MVTAAQAYWLNRKRRRARNEGGGVQLFGPLALARTQRIDIVGIGDSNQLKDSTGWDQGIQVGMINAGAQMYATPLISTNENNADGGGVGYTCNFNAAQPVLGAITGAPSELDDYLKTTGGSISPHNYAYLVSGSFTNGNNSGLVLAQNGALGTAATEALRFHLNYGTFDSGSGSFRFSVRVNSSPFSQQVESSLISTNTGAIGMAVASLDLPANAVLANYPLNMKLTGTTNGITGPYFSLWMRAEVPGRTEGFSYHTLHGLGGDSLRDMANSMECLSDNTLSYFFGEVRRLQGSSKCVVIWVNAGLNDRSEASTSVGPAAETDGDSPEAFADNGQALVERIQAIWTLNGWDQDELHFVFMVSHPISNPDDTELVSYRSAIAAYVATLDQGYIVDLAAKITSTQISANSWYASSNTDTAHLVAAGYDGIGKLAVAR